MLHESTSGSGFCEETPIWGLRRTWAADVARSPPEQSSVLLGSFPSTFCQPTANRFTIDPKQGSDRADGLPSAA